MLLQGPNRHGELTEERSEELQEGLLYWGRTLKSESYF